MKKLLTILLLFISFVTIGQNTKFNIPSYLYAKDTISRLATRPWVLQQFVNFRDTLSGVGGGTGTVTSVTAVGGTGISITGSPITTSGTFTITNSLPMVYPGAGISKSTGSAWATSLVDSSAYWSEAYSWGDHSGVYFAKADSNSNGNAATKKYVDGLVAAKASLDSIPFQRSPAARTTVFLRNSGDNVGIGTVSPAQKLDVSGKIALDGTVIAYRPTALTGSIVFGNGGASMSGTNNTYVGLSCGTNITSGSYNTGIGASALSSNTDSQNNTAVGYAALTSLGAVSSSGALNTVIGSSALLSMSTGASNVAVGGQAGMLDQLNNSGVAGLTNSVLIGAAVRPYATGDANEIVIGYDARGAGSNSATLGNTSITKTVLRGDIQSTGLNRKDTSFMLMGYNGTTGSFNAITGGAANNFMRYQSGMWKADTIANAATSSRGLLTSTDWNTFNGKLAASDSSNSVRAYKFDAAGDLLVGSGNNTYVKLGKGSNGQSLRTISGTVQWFADSVGSGSGSSYWTTCGTFRKSAYNQFKIFDDDNADSLNKILQRGTVIKWTDNYGITTKVAMVTGTAYASDTVTVDIMGDSAVTVTTATLKYCQEKARMVTLAYAGTAGVADDACGRWFVPEPIKILGVDAYCGTAGTTNSLNAHLNINGTTSMWVSNPIAIASGATAGTAFPLKHNTSTANLATTSDYLSIDITAVSSVSQVDLYFNVWYFPRYNYLLP